MEDFLRTRPEGTAAVARLGRDLLALAGLETVNRYRLTALPRCLARAPPWRGAPPPTHLGLTCPEDLGRCDGPTLMRAIRAVVKPNDRVGRSHLRSVLFAARASPTLDPPPHRFQSHWCVVARDVLDRWPVLWDYPAGFARTLTAEFPPADVDHWLELLRRWLMGRQHAHGTEEARRRTRSAASHECLRVARLRHRFDAAGAETPWTALLPWHVTAEGLHDLCARVCAAHHRHGAPRGAYTNTLGTHTASAEMLVKTFDSWIAHHVFPLVGTALTAHALRERMVGWEARDPAHYAATPRVRPLPRTRPEVNDETVARLLEACRTARERAMLLLLTELGLRAGALCHMRVDDVWEHGRPRSEAHLLEKGAVRRHVWFSPRLRSCLREYVQGEHAGRSALLFPAPRSLRRDLPVPHVAAWLRALCRRADVPRVNAHQFRHCPGPVPARTPDPRHQQAGEQKQARGRVQVDRPPEREHHLHQLLPSRRHAAHGGDDGHRRTTRRHAPAQGPGLRRRAPGAPRRGLGGPRPGTAVGPGRGRGTPQPGGGEPEPTARARRRRRRGRRPVLPLITSGVIYFGGMHRKAPFLVHVCNRSLGSCCI